MKPLKLDLLNKRGLFNFEVLELYECGIVLTGEEYKLIRDRYVSFSPSSYAEFINNELFLKGINISDSNVTTRNIKLLMHKRELRKISSKVNEKGLTLIPRRIYQKGNLIKIELALAKGRNQISKKSIKKSRDILRDTERQLKNY